MFKKNEEKLTDFDIDLLERRLKRAKREVSGFFFCVRRIIFILGADYFGGSRIVIEMRIFIGCAVCRYQRVQCSLCQSLLLYSYTFLLMQSIYLR